jgi:hypothetical protein
MRRVLALGVGLTLVGLVGLAVTAGNPAASRTLVRYVFIPAYIAGALCLIWAGAMWLRSFMTRR